MWAQQTTPDTLWQFGLAGVVLLMVLGFTTKFVLTVYNDQKARAERAEEKLAEQNKLIQGELFTQLSRATEAVADVLAERRQR